MKKILFTVLAMLGVYFAQAQCNTSFSYTISGSTISCTNTSQVSLVPGSWPTVWYSWGDGSPSTAASYVNGTVTNHTYTASGTYLVILHTNYYDSLNSTVICNDTIHHWITISVPTPNEISGTITWDSTLNVWSSSLKVWLITYDATTNIIDAVDSQVVSGGYNQINYSFNNVAAGDYRVKAAVMPNANGASQMAPTYHQASTYWGTANVINHTGGASIYKHILMQAGSSTSGPGFIAGNVTQGAGKGTGAGVPNLLVLLRDASNQMVSFTYTDANGDYSFNNIATGTYNIYPENMPQVTTPSSSINITSGAPSVTAIDFEKKSATIKPKTTGIENMPAANIFSIYPNPTEGIVNLNWNSNVTGTVGVQVVDMTGREIYNGTANTNAAASINMNHVPAGVYFIKVASDKAQHTQKLIIQ